MRSAVHIAVVVVVDTGDAGTADDGLDTSWWVDAIHIDWDGVEHSVEEDGVVDSSVEDKSGADLLEYHCCCDGHRDDRRRSCKDTVTRDDDDDDDGYNKVVRIDAAPVVVLVVDTTDEIVGVGSSSGLVVVDGGSATDEKMKQWWKENSRDDEALYMMVRLGLGLQLRTIYQAGLRRVMVVTAGLSLNFWQEGLGLRFVEVAVPQFQLQLSTVSLSGCLHVLLEAGTGLVMVDGAIYCHISEDDVSVSVAAGGGRNLGCNKLSCSDTSQFQGLL
jgi:hypothetical protein